MAVNKVEINGTTVIDLTSDTIAADKLLQGYTAHDKSGSAITGTYPQSCTTEAIYRSRRPADWMEMPPESSIADGEMYVLLLIPATGSENVGIIVGYRNGKMPVSASKSFAFGTTNANGTFTVNPDVPVQTVTADGLLYTLYASDWSVTTSDGYKQVMVKITCDMQYSTQIYIGEYYDGATGTMTYTDNLVADVAGKMTKSNGIFIENCARFLALALYGTNVVTSYPAGMLIVRAFDSSTVTSIDNDTFRQIIAFPAAVSLAAYHSTDGNYINFNPALSNLTITAAGYITDISYMFQDSRIESLDLAAFTAVAAAGQIFIDCKSREIINFDISNLASDSNYIGNIGSPALKRMLFVSGKTMAVGANFSLSNCRGMTAQAIADMFDTLPTVTGTNGEITFSGCGTDLTAAQIAIATAKGWTVTQSDN